MSNSDGGFWRLRHDHLAALLARSDLSWAVIRVYLALADLTWGYGKERDEVSLSQIAEHAGMFSTDRNGRQNLDIPHTNRALKELARLGLYGSADGKGQAVVRWVVWPPPEYRPAGTAEHGTTAKAGSSATAEDGTGTTAKPTAKATATGGTGTTARPGTHQEDQENQEHQEEREKTAAGKDSLAPSVLQRSKNGNGNSNGNGGGKENDIDKIIAHAFLSGNPPAAARDACLDRIGEALRLGATPQLIAWGVKSQKLDGAKPWDRIQEIGEKTAAFLGRCRAFWSKCEAKTLTELFGWVDGLCGPKKPKGRTEAEQKMIDEILGYRSQAENWPEVGPAAGVLSQERRDDPGAARGEG
ncbi:MAG: replication protein [Planctomycetota bacterium]|nr:replication protein [Planctomycetota bacterium]